MKNFCLRMACAALSMVALTACNEKKTATLVPHMDGAFADAAADTTLYGRCTENLGMNSLELVTDEGDTLQLLTDDMTSDSTLATNPLKGGKGIGDRMAVVAHKNSDGDLVIEKAVNLTTLIGKWTALDKSFEIQEGGIVVSNFQEPKPYTEWKISNGKLVLSADTFDVYELGADSLLLENKKGIYSYKRQK